MINIIAQKSINELEKIIVELSEPKFRAKQIFEWIHQKMVWDYDQMSNLPLKLKEKLANKYPLKQIKIVEKYQSAKDETTKYLLELPDSNIIESVLMRYKHGYTLCISSQVGCRMGCKFCASTINGLVRNLTSAEMLAQVYFISKDCGQKINNIVIMGCGEPLEDLDATLNFVSLINNPNGQNIGQRHITISTCGLVPAILKLAENKLQITLAISLHASTDSKRQEIMPIARKYTIEQLLDACNIYTNKTGRRISFEYALISGENDTKEEAIQLAKLLKGMLCHVNLIPVNSVEERHYKSTNEQGVQLFANTLKQYHIETTIRRKLGEDIDAACGQLRHKYLKKRGD